MAKTELEVAPHTVITVTCAGSSVRLSGFEHWLYQRLAQASY